jgi:hypothetical protein
MVVFLDVYTYTAIMAGLTALLGLVVYIVFYWFFQETAGRSEVEVDEVKRKIVFSGFIVDEPEFPSVTALVRDIFSRAFRRGFKIVERTSRGLVLDWYLIGYLLMLTLLLVGVASWIVK